MAECAAQQGASASARRAVQHQAVAALHAESLNLNPHSAPLQYSTANFSGDWVLLVFDPGV